MEPPPSGEADEQPSDALKARVAATRATLLDFRGGKRLYITLGAFVAAACLVVIFFGTYHRRTPACTVAWDAWTTLDRYRARHLSRERTLDRLDHDLASMRLHLAALRRQRQTQAARSWADLTTDVADTRNVLAAGGTPAYTRFAAQDQPMALYYAGCRGPTPRLRTR